MPAWCRLSAIVSPAMLPPTTITSIVSRAFCCVSSAVRTDPAHRVRTCDIGRRLAAPDICDCVRHDCGSFRLQPRDANELAPAIAFPLDERHGLGRRTANRTCDE